MNIFDRATEIQVQLKAATEADSSDELLSRSRRVRMDLDDAATYFEAVNSFRSALDVQDAPNIDIKGFRQSLGRFRGALSRSGPAAVQQQTAATLLKAVETERTRLDRWAKLIWKSRFGHLQSLLDRVESGGLLGSTEHWRKARRCASQLRSARNTDPIHAIKELERILDATGLDACLEKISILGDELSSAIESIDQEHSDLTSEVRTVLDRAASSDGFPLDEITSEILEALKSAGVLRGLVVRRA